MLFRSGAFADLAFYEEVKQAAREGGAKVHLASGAIGGFDVLQTVTLMAEALKLDEKAGIETHTGAKGFRNTPVWADHLLTDTEKTTVFTGSTKEAIATFPRRVNVAVATSLATTGPDITGVTMHSVPGWVGDDHCITAEIEGVKAVEVSRVLKKLPRQARHRVLEITLDMSGSMHAIARECFPNAEQVIDRFHVQKLACDALQELRIEHRWEAINEETNEMEQARLEGRKYRARKFRNGETRKEVLFRSRLLLFKDPAAWSVNQRNLTRA